MHSCLWASQKHLLCVNGFTNPCFFLSLSVSLAARVSGEETCASGGKHIGQLRQRLCAALLCVSLIESQRQPLTALHLRTLQVITHKSLFPCIGSSAQLRPHKQSASVSFITSGCLLTFSGSQSDRQFRYITLSRRCYSLSLQDRVCGVSCFLCINITKLAYVGDTYSQNWMDICSTYEQYGQEKHLRHNIWVTETLLDH